MESGKADNQLNLAVSVTEEERRKSADLNVGYIEQTKQWELIVKYHGDIEKLAGQLGIQVVPLLNKYAVVTIEESRIPAFLQLEEIEFVEKPNRLIFELETASEASCIPVLQAEFGSLTGAGVLVGIIDSGIDFTHPDFRNADGTTRIVSLWDQNVPGGVYTEEQINATLLTDYRTEQYRPVSAGDISGHGTAVAGIAAGNGRASDGRYRGVAYESRIIAVRLGNSVGGSFPRTTNLMTAVDFVAKEALRLSLPVAINISLGNNYGAHDGTSLLERYLDAVSDFWKMCIVIGMGNEGAARGHAAGILTGGDTQTIEFAVGDGQRSLSLQLWKQYTDRFDVELVTPSGQSLFLRDEEGGNGRIRRGSFGGTQILAYMGEPKPYSVNEEVYIELLPVSERIDSGVWQVRLYPAKIVSGVYNLWLPGQETLEPGTGFLRPSEETTLTIPASSLRVISVGAYDSNSDTYASYSGRGYVVGTQNEKPDIVAPGTRILTAAPGGGYAVRTGTSMATPFVTGAAALLMQWGITQEHDPYLYGEKVKAYLRRGAGSLPGFAVYPNRQLGWGTLCVRNSLPGE